MNRRSFMQTIVGGMATAAAVRTFPFRVFSFPGSLAMPLPEFTAKYVTPSIDEIHAQYLRGARAQLAEGFDWYISRDVPVLMVDRESVVINSWNPKTEQIIGTRGIA